MVDFPVGPTFDENNFVCVHRTVTGQPGRQEPCGHFTDTVIMYCTSVHIPGTAPRPSKCQH